MKRTLHRTYKKKNKKSIQGISKLSLIYLHKISYDDKWRTIEMCFAYSIGSVHCKQYRIVVSCSIAYNTASALMHSRVNEFVF